MTLPAFACKLTAEQETAVQELMASVADQVKDSPSLQAFCNQGTCVRFLRARSWNVQKATKMLHETLAWRASYKPDQIRWEDVAGEAADGKMWVLEHPDREGRPVVLMRPRNEASQNNDSRIRYLVYTLEQASRLADEWGGDGKMAWLVDFVGYTRKNAPPIKVSLHTLHILQNHYPERLGKAVSYIPPIIFNLMWRAVSPFIDPVTHKKLVFLNKKAAAAGDLDQHFDLDHLDETLGGKLPLAQAFDLVRLERRYREADAAVDRHLLQLTQGAGFARPPEAAAAAPSGGQRAPLEAVPVVAVGEAVERQGMPSPEVSEGSVLGEEGSGSVAEGMRSSLGGEEEEAEAEEQTGEGVVQMVLAVGALKVA